MTRVQAHAADGVLATNDVGDIILLHHLGDNDPATDLDTTAGYAPGCIAINSNLTDQTDAIYVNIATNNTSANFNVATVASD